MEVRAAEGYQLTVGLEAQEIVKPDGSKIGFDVDPFRKKCLLEGLDQIGLTLIHEERITAYEKQRDIA